MTALAWPVVFLVVAVLAYDAGRRVLAHVKERAKAADVNAEHAKRLDALAITVGELKAKAAQERTAQALGGPRRQ